MSWPMCLPDSIRIPLCPINSLQIVKFIGSGQTSAMASVMVLLDLVCVASDDPQLCQQFLNSAQKMISSTAARKSAASGGSLFSVGPSVAAISVCVYMHVS